MSAYKIIRDSVHGSIRVDEPFLPLLESNELQRLHSVHQLGLANLVYPGANHTRLEHSLGTFAVASRMSSSLQLSHDEDLLVRCAALLHDIGHLPYSHTFEMVLHEQFGIDHVEISKRLIRGEDSIVSEAERSVLGGLNLVVDALEGQGIDPGTVASLLDDAHRASLQQRTLESHEGQAHFNDRRYLSQMVSGVLDVDQLDYLVRDAHYTGVAYGVIDLDRLIDTVQIFNGDLVVQKGGVSAVEGMLVARALMFSSVYYHKTVRIAELMLAKAVERLGPEEIGEIFRMTDSTLLSHLVSKGGYFEQTAARIKYRRLFKKAFALSVLDIDEGQWPAVDALGEMAKRRAVEEDIAQRAGVDSGEVIIDVPSHELPVSEPRISLTDIRVIDGSRVRLLPKLSSIAQSLQNRRVHEWAVMVACPEEHKEKVARAAKKSIQI
ncbi:MAG: HD domain-containing protein [Thermoplasmata archaeon]